MLIALFPNEKKKHSFDLAIEIRDFFERHGIGVVAEDVIDLPQGVEALLRDLTKTKWSKTDHAQS